MGVKYYRRKQPLAGIEPTQKYRTVYYLYGRAVCLFFVLFVLPQVLPPTRCRDRPYILLLLLLLPCFSRPLRLATIYSQYTIIHTLLFVYLLLFICFSMSASVISKCVMCCDLQSKPQRWPSSTRRRPLTDWPYAIVLSPCRH